METAGVLRSYHYDEEKRQFEMSFEGSEGECKIYCPFLPRSVTENRAEGEFPVDYSVEMAGEEACYVFFRVDEPGSYSVHID